MTTSTKCRHLDELVQLYLYVYNYTDSTLVRVCELKENIFIFLTQSPKCTFTSPIHTNYINKKANAMINKDTKMD